MKEFKEDVGELFVLESALHSVRCRRKHAHIQGFNQKPAVTDMTVHVGFSTKNFPKERVLCIFRVNHIPSILFILLSGAE